MRRGLRRSDGFALFIAVCNSPATVGELIRLTAEAMPDVVIRTVTLGEDVTDPLAAVLKQLPADSEGPVMVLGLERAAPATEKEHPVLRTLNLGRPEWRRKLPWPVVFWLPEYLLELMAREAPDFLDWRSDTLHFAASAPEALEPLDSPVWRRGADGRMPRQERLVRIEELRWRLAATPETGDPVTSAARLDWVHELGNHLFFLGRLAEAEQAYRTVVDLQADPERGQHTAGAYHMLGWIAQLRGSYDEALAWYRKSLQIQEELGNRAGIAASYHHLGMVAHNRGSWAEAGEWYRKALRVSEELGNRASVASSYGQLGALAQLRGSWAEAGDWYRKALRIFEELGYRTGMANLWHQLGTMAQQQGSYDEASDWYRKALRTNEELGNRPAMAANCHQLGSIAKERGAWDEALAWYRESLRIKEELGLRAGMASTLSSIGALWVRRGEPQEGVAFNLRSLAIRRELRMPAVHLDVTCLRRQRELLGTEAFDAIVTEHLGAEGLASVLGLLQSGVEEKA